MVRGHLQPSNPLDALSTGLSIGIELLNDRRFGRLRQIAEDQIDLVANLLRCHIAVLLQKESDYDLS